MTNRSKPLYAAIVSAAIAGIGATAWGEPTTQQDVSSEIQALKARIEQLETKQKAQAAESQAIKQRDEQAAFDRVLSDADRHGRLFDAEPFMAGYDPSKGFVLRSEDGNYLLHPWFQLQFRDVTNERDGAKSGNRDDMQNGFELRRMKFGFDGHAFTPDFTYLFNWATDRKSGAPILEEGWGRYKLPGLPLAVKGGQIKDPLDHEQIMSSKYQMAIERTLVDDVFAKGDAFVQGVSAIYDAGADSPVRAEVAFTDGLGSNNTNFQDFPTSGIPADWGAAGRVEYKVFGNWKEYDHFSSLGDKENLLVLGAGADYTEAGHTRQLTFVGDAQANFGPLSLYGAFLGRYIAHNAGASNANTFDPTARIQAAYLVTPTIEPYLRYEYIHFDGPEFASTIKHNVHELTAGLNWYVHGKAAKFTFDVVYLPNGTPVADDGSGVLTQSNGRNEWIGRAQFQLLL